MIRAVIDTNVLVSALLNPHGMPGRILDTLLRGAIVPVFDSRILDEYREVLSRASFDFAPGDVERLLILIERTGEFVVAQPLSVQLTDPDDQPFLEVAVSAACRIIITGNARHFGTHATLSVRIVSPALFVREFMANT